MKNLWIRFGLLLAITPLLTASNCVSRVDKNLHKTTTEKVNYCLEEDKEPEPDKNKTDIVWSDTYTVQYPKPKNKSTEPESNTQIKTVNKTPVSMEYLDQKTYPSFRNDTMPRLSPDQANATALEALRENHPETGKANKTDKKAKPKVKMNKPTKPARQMPGQTVPDNSQAAQVQQAQALQNDPLAINPPDNQAAPSDFVDDSIMGPAGFGYNATDPAFQQ